MGASPRVMKAPRNVNQTAMLMLLRAQLIVFHHTHGTGKTELVYTGMPATFLHLWRPAL
jgi:hypothetical protein